MSSAAYAYASAGNQANSTSTSTLSAAMPAGGGAASIAAGDVIFLLAKSQTESATSTHSVPAGYGELGSIVRSDAGSGFARRYGAIQLWWKVAGVSEPSASVTLNSPGSGYDWTVQAYTYRAIGGSPLAKIVAACLDDTTGTTGAATYTPPSRTAPVGTVLAFIAQNRISGTLNEANAQGFTTRVTGTNEPAHKMMDKAVTAGSVTLPTLGIVGGTSRPWMSKSLVLDRDPGAGEWGVDRIAW